MEYIVTLVFQVTNVQAAEERNQFIIRPIQQKKFIRLRILAHQKKWKKQMKVL